MIVITGAGGFIGYNMLKSLYGMYDIVAVDNNIGRLVKRGLQNITYLSVEDSFLWLQFNAPAIEYVIHLGARTDTAEKDVRIFDQLNVNYSKFIWTFCTEERIPLIYASSAAVYGDGALGFSDGELEWYHPLNPYGLSKFRFDIFADLQKSEENSTPPFWAGLRFFNVYGPHEDHKGRMASVVWHLYNQVKETGGVKLFKSHRDDYMHGYQMRDFIYVRDVVNVILWFMMRASRTSGIYNLGTGKARTYNDLAKAIFKSLGKEENIQYIDMPEDIRDSYQYFTEAPMDKLRNAGYDKEFRNLEDGIDEYITLLEDENC
jgi:ADP-L-glycero-D-manno-heptose 6-epimerase